MPHSATPSAGPAAALVRVPSSPQGRVPTCPQCRVPQPPQVLGPQLSPVLDPQLAPVQGPTAAPRAGPTAAPSLRPTTVPPKHGLQLPSTQCCPQLPQDIWSGMTEAQPTASIYKESMSAFTLKDAHLHVKEARLLPRNARASLGHLHGAEGFQHPSGPSTACLGRRWMLGSLSL